MGRNKLNGTDGIMPLLLELAIKRNSQILFCVSEYNLTYKAIQDNILFRDILFKHGSLNLLGGFSKNRLSRYVTWMFQLFFIFAQGVAGANFIHYGQLNRFPFSLLRIAFGKNIFLVENNTNETFYGSAMENVRKVCLGKVKKNKKSYLFDDDCKDDRIIFRKSTMEKYKKSSCYKFYFYGRSRSRPVWLDYLSQNKSKYFEKYHPDFKDHKCIIIIGTWYDGCFYNNIPKVFEKMLDVFKDNFSEEYFLFKPHPLTNNKYIKEQMDKRGLKYEITYLHPNLLAMHAKVFIGNNFSNMMTDGFLFNIPTIEFSNYIDELLQITKGGSSSNKYVSYFINNNETQFNSVLSRVILEEYKDNSTKHELKAINEPSADDVLNLLS